MNINSDNEYFEKINKTIEKRDFINGNINFQMGCNAIWQLLEKYIKAIENSEDEQGKEKAVQDMINRIKSQNDKIKNNYKTLK